MKEMHGVAKISLSLWCANYYHQ